MVELFKARIIGQVLLLTQFHPREMIGLHYVHARGGGRDMKIQVGNDFRASPILPSLDTLRPCFRRMRGKMTRVFSKWVERRFPLRFLRSTSRRDKTFVKQIWEFLLFWTDPPVTNGTGGKHVITRTNLESIPNSLKFAVRIRYKGLQRDLSPPLPSRIWIVDSVNLIFKLG